MSNVFKTKLSTASLVLIPACIGINYLGKLFSFRIKAPVMVRRYRNLYRGCPWGSSHWCNLWSSQ